MSSIISRANKCKYLASELEHHRRAFAPNFFVESYLFFKLTEG